MMQSIKQLATNALMQSRIDEAEKELNKEIRTAEVELARLKAQLAAACMIRERWAVGVDCSQVFTAYKPGAPFVAIGLVLWGDAPLVLRGGGVSLSNMRWHDSHYSNWVLSIDGVGEKPMWSFSEFPAAVAFAYKRYLASMPEDKSVAEVGGVADDMAFDANRESAWAARPKGRD